METTENCVAVSETQLKHLIENYYTKVLKMDSGQSRELSINNDSGSVWIPKSDLDDLFSAYSDPNGEAGVRIHFVMLDSSMPSPLSSELDSYHNQLSVVLEVEGTSASSLVTPVCICPPCRCRVPRVPNG